VGAQAGNSPFTQFSGQKVRSSYAAVQRGRSAA
jgi:hypothetical protein